MKLTQMRLSKNMTQDDLAKKLNVSRTTVTMWENGKSSPNIKMLKKITELFNCNVEDLI